MPDEFIRDIFRLPINVFLSSTYMDLKAERESIYSSLRRLKWPQVQWMEGELSQDAPILRRCLEMVDDSQIYIGLIGSRYGTTIEDDEGVLSMTEREFDRATDLCLYRMVFISENRKTDTENGLRAFKEKIQNSVWPDYFKNKDDLTAKVSLALANIWNELNGRMHVVVLRPWTDFAASTDLLVETRKCIAADCGVDPAKVWLTAFDAPIPEVTKFIALLPNRYKSKYLGLNPNNRSGSIIYASNYEPDMPFNPELAGLFYTLHNVVQNLSSQQDERFKAVNEWMSKAIHR